MIYFIICTPRLYFSSDAKIIDRFLSRNRDRVVKYRSWLLRLVSMLSLMQKIGCQKRDTWLKDRNYFSKLTHKQLFSEKDNFSLNLSVLYTYFCRNVNQQIFT